MQPELAEVLRVLCMSKRSFRTFRESVLRWTSAVERPCSTVQACALSDRFRDRWLSLALTLLDVLRHQLSWPHHLWQHMEV
jgi:hypothetical protein